jgi:small membrane protein
VIIKLLLLGALGLAAVTLVRGRRSALHLLMRRSITLTAIGAGGLAIVFPEGLTRVAHAVGVGRGADLLLYALCVAFLFVSIALYLRLKELDDRFVELARRHALLAAWSGEHPAEVRVADPGSPDSGRLRRRDGHQVSR